MNIDTAPKIYVCVIEGEKIVELRYIIESSKYQTGSMKSRAVSSTVDFVNNLMLNN